MAYDEELAGRVRQALGERADFDEKKMFGGVAFMVNTHMACGIIRNDLMVRVGKPNHEDALSRGAREMEMGGRSMPGMVIVPGDSLADPDFFESWMTTAVDFARSEPPKPPKSPKSHKSAKRAKPNR
jgi:TfoX/Sxy family transcriptional regulator of competence genes